MRWFHEDPAAESVDDQFMFGPDLLVVPVLEEGVRRRVYLPAGATWRDAWTDEALHGDQWLVADASLARIPLCLRDGASLPIQA